MQAVILVGGEGTRLRPLTLPMPKPMVPLVNRPFLDYQVELIKRHGIREIVFAVSYKLERIRDFFGTGAKWGMKFHYAVEKERLGTGGAIKNAEPFIRDRAMIFNGDVLTDLDLTAVIRAHDKAKAFTTIVLTQVPDPSHFGVVEFRRDRAITRFIEKPKKGQTRSRWISAGTYVFERENFTMMPPACVYSVERGHFPLLLKQKKPFFAFCSGRYWMDIGTPEKYLSAHLDIIYGRFDAPFLGRPNAVHAGKKCRLSRAARYGKPLRMGDRCRVEAGASLQAAVLGNECHIGPGASVQNAVLWDDVKVGEGAVLNGCIIASGCVIGPYAQVTEGTVLGRGSKVTPHSTV